VERDGYSFIVEVIYKRYPLFCSHCHFIGHNLSNCKWLYPSKDNDEANHGKKPLTEDTVTKKVLKQRTMQQKYVNVDTSAVPTESQTAQQLIILQFTK